MQTPAITIKQITAAVAAFAPPELAEEWDNNTLITGNSQWPCTGVLCTLDVTEAVVAEAVQKNCNLIVAHHPILFKGIKKLTGADYVSATIIAAIKNDVAIYTAHTALDNVLLGVNGYIADKLSLQHCKILAPKKGVLRRLITFAPHDKAEAVRAAVFAAGAGQIGKYSECSFNSRGTGTFKAEEGADPYVGEIGKQHSEEETKIEIVFPAYMEAQVVEALIKAHPYEEVAYDIFVMANVHQGIGSGLVGTLPEPIEEEIFLQRLQQIFAVPVIRHTAFLGKPVKTVALCGGSGAFLIKNARAAGADAYLTADVKYHEFFDAEGKILLADVGHYETEQFTAELLQQVLAKKFPTFAVLKTSLNTNPVQYWSEALGNSKG